MTIIWIIVFIVSLLLLIGGADWLLDGAQKVGIKMGLSPFIIGITIVAVGTSLPEIVSSIIATIKGVSDFAVANAVGSNIANILLVVGLATLFAKKLQVTKDLINLDLPLLAISTSIFFLVAADGEINFFESLFLVATYIIYVGFALIYKEEDEIEVDKTQKISYWDIIKLFLGCAGLYLGAKYLVDSVQAIASMSDKIDTGMITIAAVAVGTSLPEIVVSVKAAIKRQSEVALGNIFGSNIFNILMVVGIPGLFSTLKVDGQIMTLGLPVLAVTTALFVISGISRRIHVQEGAMFLLLYVIFIAKLFGLF